MGVIIRKLAVLLLFVVFPLLLCHAAIDDAYTYTDDEYQFSIQLYPEYENLQSPVSIKQSSDGKSEKRKMFEASRDEKNGIYDSVMISLIRVDEADKAKMKEGYRFGGEITRDGSGLEQSLANRGSAGKLYVYSREEEEKLRMDYYTFFPEDRPDLCVKIAFIYPYQDRVKKKYQIRDMLSTMSF
jgi:hypothetical protein